MLVLKLSSSEITRLSTLGELVLFPKDTVIFKLGDLGQTMYYIKKGTVQLVFPKPILSKTLGPGNVFGELAFLKGEHQRTAHVQATEDSELIVMDRQAVAKMEKATPGIFCKILRHACLMLLKSEQSLVAYLTKKNQELVQTLDYLRRTKEELGYKDLLANTDSLTSLYNRRCFDHNLPRFMEQARTDGKPLGLILIDLDFFKEINDTYGHQVGDLVLQKVAGLIHEACRETDLVCRLGGDEFAILLPGMPQKRGAAISQSILQRIKQFPLIEGQSTIKIGCSGGGTVMQKEDHQATFFSRADRQLYAAKGQGRNTFVWG